MPQKNPKASKSVILVPYLVPGIFLSKLFLVPEKAQSSSQKNKKLQALRADQSTLVLTKKFSSCLKFLIIAGTSPEFLSLELYQVMVELRFVASLGVIRAVRPLITLIDGLKLSSSWLFLELLHFKKVQVTLIIDVSSIHGLFHFQIFGAKIRTLASQALASHQESTPCVILSSTVSFFGAKGSSLKPFFILV